MGRFEILLLLLIGNEVMGGKRTLTLSELLQLKEGGLALEEYNSVEDKKPSDEALSALNKRKPKCFGSSSPSQVPFQTWGMDPRVENSTSSSESPPSSSSSPLNSSTPSYYYSGPILSTPILS